MGILVIYLSLFIESAPVYSTKLLFYFISDGRCLARSKLIISINDAKNDRNSEIDNDNTNNITAKRHGQFFITQT